MKANLLRVRSVIALTYLLVILLGSVSSAYSQTTSKTVFTYTGSDQSYTVPTGVTSITIKAWGAGGGGANSLYYNVQSGGAGGGFATATITVVPNSVLTVRVGQGGITSSAATTYGGGGSGNNFPTSGSNIAGGGSGGGYSGVFNSTTPLVIAGGGGGGSAGADNGSPVAGGGGGLTGGTNTYAGAGKGGTQSAGGAAGIGITVTGATAPTAGSSLQGGNGGRLATNGESGGGGGGGYYGGGGGFYQQSGGAAANGNGPGGGGSSYYISTATGASTTAGGNGAFENQGGAAANKSDADYVAGTGTGTGNGVGAGGPGTAAGNGRVVISYVTILPLKLIEFKAIKENNSAALSWKTESEENTSHFAVERSVDNGDKWQTIKTVTAFGMGNHSYTATDNNLLKGATYFRLKMFDKDGSYQISPIRVINFSNKQNVISVFPNPVKTTLSVIGMEQGDQASLFDMSGASLRRITAGANGVETMSVEDLPSGTYILNIKGANGQSTTKKINVVK